MRKIFYSSGMLAVAALASGQVPEPTDEAVAALAEELAPCVRTLEKPYRFFHYVTKENVQRFLPKDRQISSEVLKSALTNHLRDWSQYYEKETSGGLFAALDPVASRAWGGFSKAKYWLYRFEMPAGVRYVAPFQDCARFEKSPAFLKGAACPGKPEVFRYLKEGSCATLFRRAFARLGAIAYAYEWREYAVDLPGCSSRPKEAFVFFDLGGLPAQAVARFANDEIPAKSSPLYREAMVIAKMLADRRTDGIWPKLGPELQRRTADPKLRAELESAVRDYKTKYLMGCEPPRAAALPACYKEEAQALPFSTRDLDRSLQAVERSLGD